MSLDIAAPPEDVATCCIVSQGCTRGRFRAAATIGPMAIAQNAQRGREH
jgi:hypothetical protein